jgi:hypothetical protein
MNLNDSGFGSLRQAIIDTPSGGIVNFQSGLSGTITLTSGELAISQNLTITGPGAGIITVSGNNASRVFEVVPAVTVAISGLTIANGRSLVGGGVFNSGMLTITDSTISGNTATTAAFHLGGGGIYNDNGTVTVTGCTLSGNSALRLGGGILNDPGGSVSVTASTLSGNSAGLGGGIVNRFATLTVTASTLSDNDGSVGGIYNEGGTVSVTASTLSGNFTLFNGDGGGILNDPGGTVSVTASTLSSNSGFFGGGIYNQVGGTVSVTACTLSGNSALDGGGILNAGMLTVDSSTLSGNSATSTIGGQGGGISNFGTLTVTASTLSGNRADDVGGGIDNEVGTVSVTASTLSGNSANAISTSGRGKGGGIWSVGGTVSVTASTLSGNSALGSPSSSDPTDGSGGGIYSVVGTVAITASTLSDNHADASGGGIYNEGGTLTLTSSTLSGNRASVGGGGIANADGTIFLRNTIVAGTAATAASDVSGILGSLGYNLIGIGDGGSGFVSTDLVGTSTNPIDPKLGPLHANGGPTQTIALLPLSPALNTGDPAQLGTADQRGVVRSGGVNIGAYQASASALILTAPATATTGVPFDLVVTAVDRFGQTAVGYAGTVHFASSDQRATVPSDYTFMAADGGTHTFQVTLPRPGRRSLTVTDTHDASIFASIAVQVHKPGHDGQGQDGQ